MILKTLDKLKSLKELVTIEPVVCLNLISVSIREVLINDLLLNTACQVNLDQNDTTCDAIVKGLHKEQNMTALNNDIQKQVNNVLSWSLPINNALPIILLLFLGTFSDKHKIRKLFLNIPNVGEILSTVSCMLCARYQNVLPVEASAVAHFVVPAVFGRALMINMAGYAYIADVSSPKTCIIRMAMLHVCVNICKPIGMVLCYVLYQAIGFNSMFICLLMLVVAFFYGLFVLKDTREECKDTSWLELLKDSVNLDHAIETIKLLTTAKTGQRINILYVLTMTFIVTLVFTGEGNVFFWFLQHTYSWTNTNYAYFQAIRSLSNCFALAVAVPIFSKVLKLHTLTITMISLADKILSNIVCAVIPTTIGLYASVAIGILTIITCIGIRAQSTKYVAKDDMGKMQSLLSIVEAIATCVSPQVYNLGIYLMTKDTYEQGFLHLGSGLFALGFVLTLLKYYCEVEEDKALSDVA